jgi:hypothetical protein
MNYAIKGYLPLHNFAPFMTVSTMCEESRLFMEVSTRLEYTVRDTFIQHRWQRDQRIGPPLLHASLQFMCGLLVLHLFLFLSFMLDLCSCVHLIIFFDKDVHPSYRYARCNA